MAASENCYVEWKEHFVSEERGNRVVHYFLKDISGESILAVVGTERSVRHMFYVVSEEFLNAHGTENSVHTGFRWRSRREVVNWLTSVLSEQHNQGDCSKSPKDDPVSRFCSQQNHLPENKGHLARSLKGHASDISWSGVAWMCGKHLKHYPAFCRNGIKIAIHSFVFVMAEKEDRYLAYLEDMYEDKKGQKKVKVRWFHHNQEVKGVVTVRNPPPKEVFITPYAQSISAECVDGPAIILTREHYDKCRAVFPHDLLSRMHFSSRQFKGNRVKPFKLSKLHGYFDQSIFSCFGPDFFDEEEVDPDEVKVGAKRNRSCSEQNLNYGLMNRAPITGKHVDCHRCHALLVNVNEKIELLCLDSGLRGCWFRCTVVHVSQRHIKVQYDDVKDEDGCGNLEEWIPAFRVDMRDKLGIRYSGRPTIRPALQEIPDQADLAFEVGTPVDAWWSDGWWEGVITSIGNTEDEKHQVYIPSENLFLKIDRQNIRASRDWVGDKWVDIEANPNVLSVLSIDISAEAKLSVCQNIIKETQPNKCPMSSDGVPTSVGAVEEGKLDLTASLTLADGFSKNNGSVNNEQEQPVENNDDEESNGKCVDDIHEKDDFAHNLGHDTDIISHKNEYEVIDDDGDVCKLEEFDTAGLKCEAEFMEVVT